MRQNLPVHDSLSCAFRRLLKRKQSGNKRLAAVADKRQK
jgi:hypothetical protein